MLLLSTTAKMQMELASTRTPEVFASLSAYSSIFYENFESYSLGQFYSTNNWVLDVPADAEPGNQRIVNTVSFSGAKSLQLQAETSAVSISRTFVRNSKSIGYKVCVMPTDTWNGRIYTMFSNSFTETGVSIVYFEFDTICARTYYDNRYIGYTLQKYNSNEWYNVTVFTNTDDLKFSVWINGVQKGTNFQEEPGRSQWGPINSIWIDRRLGSKKAYFDDIAVFQHPGQPHSPTINTELINKYETDKLSSFFEYIWFEIKYPIDCVIDVTISDPSNINRVFLKFTGLIPDTIEMQRIAQGHYRVEIAPPEEFSVEDLRDIGYMILERLFDKILKGMGSLAPAPWSYSEPPDYVVTVDELIIEYQDGTEFRKQNPVSPRQLPTYKDVLESMLPMWGRTDMQIGTTIVSMCPVDILVTDSLGRRVGTVYQNGQFMTTVNEIPDSFYSGKDFTPEFIYIPNSSGQHTVQVVGVETGQYVLDVLYQNQSGPALGEFSGSVVKGTIHNQQIIVIPEFPSLFILPLFMIVTLLAVIFYRRRISK